MECTGGKKKNFFLREFYFLRHFFEYIAFLSPFLSELTFLSTFLSSFFLEPWAYTPKRRIDRPLQKIPATSIISTHSLTIEDSLLFFDKYCDPPCGSSSLFRNFELTTTSEARGVWLSTPYKKLKVRQGFKYLSHGICPLGGYPPPRLFRKVSLKKLIEKGGTPPS